MPINCTILNICFCDQQMDNNPAKTGLLRGGGLTSLNWFLYQTHRKLGLPQHFITKTLRKVALGITVLRITRLSLTSLSITSLNAYAHIVFLWLVTFNLTVIINNGMQSLAIIPIRQAECHHTEYDRKS
jgi:hypothetical protein